ncbi:hypothetical protein ACYPKM_04270 [Pseudomonas aeruginosa]
MKPSILTLRDIRSCYPAQVPLTDETLSLARSVAAELWRERLLERGEQPTNDRSGSCKFAALLARRLFGGKLAGNSQHVFILLDGKVVDLNFDQEDVLELGVNAHKHDPFTLEFREYRESFASCLPRVDRWVETFMNRYQPTAKANRSRRELEVAL